jgi:GT2 family glycosyltransferase
MSECSDAHVNVLAAASVALSVVIPTHQRRDSLRRALESLARQTLAPERYEVVVAVDGSTDGTLEMLSQLSTPFRLVVLAQAACSGRARACNRGIRGSRGEVVLILDDDMQPSPGLLEAHLRLHVGAAPRGVIGAVPVVVDEPASSAARFVAAKFNTHLRNLARPGARLWGRAFYSGNFSVPRVTMLSVGLYCEDFTTYGNEDVELSLRLHDAGVALVFAADAVAWQHYEKSLAAFFRDQISKGRTAVLLDRMRPDAETKERLSSHRRLSRAQRGLLKVLLSATALVPFVPERVARLLDWLDRRGVALEGLLPFASEYFFRVGAAREYRAAASRPSNGGGWWRRLHFSRVRFDGDTVAQHEAYVVEWPGSSVATTGSRGRRSGDGGRS